MINQDFLQQILRSAKHRTIFDHSNPFWDEVDCNGMEPVRAGCCLLNLIRVIYCNLHPLSGSVAAYSTCPGQRPAATYSILLAPAVTRSNLSGSAAGFSALSGLAAACSFLSRSPKVC